MVYNHLLDWYWAGAALSLRWSLGVALWRFQAPKRLVSRHEHDDFAFDYRLSQSGSILTQSSRDSQDVEFMRFRLSYMWVRSVEM